MVKVVLDTNVYISALRYGGKPAQALDLALSGEYVLLVSTPLKLELERILAGKFSYSSAELRETVAILWKRAVWVEPRQRLALCRDEADNRILECALEGGARFLVTGDRDLLCLSPIVDLEILRPDEFLLRFRAAHPGD